MLAGSRVRIYRDKGNSGTMTISAEQGRALVLSDSREGIQVLTPTSLVWADVSFFGINVNRNRSTGIEVYNGDIRINRRPWINSNYLTSRIEKRLKNEALVIRSDEACRIDPPSATGYVSSPPVPVRGERFTMMDRAISFLRDSSDDFPLAASLVPVECNLIPGRATIFVDGAPRRSGTGGDCVPMLLKKGDHRVVVRADGYLPREIDLNTMDSRKIEVTLQRDNREGYPAWARTLQSEYLFRAEGGIIISVSKNGRVSASNGRRIVWDLEMGAPLARAPLYKDNRLVFATRDGLIHALKTGKGEMIWEAPFGELHGLHLGSAGDVFLATGNHIICREGTSGTIRWSRAFDSGLTGAISSDPAMVYISLESGEILGLNPDSGKRIRSTTIDGPASLLAVEDERVFAGTETGLVIALNSDLEAIEWKRVVSSFPAFEILPDSGGLIVLSGEGKVERITGKGELHWSHNLGYTSNGGLTMDSSRVYVTGPETLVVIDKHQGKVYWSLVIPGVLSRSVALGPGRIFFVTAPRGLVALKR
jgi:outer membrane protein assembly factor BamB